MSPGFAIVGAGAIGSVLGWRLARAGAPVVMVGRGEHLEAMRRDGLRLADASGEARVTVDARTGVDGLGPADVVFLATKAHDIAGALDTAAPLIGPQTLVIPAINGLPWWYFQRAGGPHDGQTIRCLDPDGSLAARLDPARLVGAVVHLGAEVIAPGVVRQAGDNRLAIGELDGSTSERATRVARILSDAGLPTTLHPAIRDEVWSKLVGNLSTNPLSVVTGATLDRLFNEPGLLEIVQATMLETMTVGAAYSVRFALDPARRIAVGRRLGAFRTSMLQDFERGRRLELPAIVESVIELGERAGVPMPTTKMVLALAQAAQRSAELARARR